MSEFDDLRVGVEPIAQLVEAFCLSLQPPPDCTISEWAETHRMLSTESAARRGKWVSWPFQKEPMDCLSPQHPCDQVVLMCASQMMKTEIILN
ncbi:MAG: hypothetical protein E6Q97_19770 [Desulfurellales bacterium]|nr:MAG: hypothetical protein E6Q97_19770 [Desulfurellales bacterium]